MKILTLLSRVILGLMFLVFGLNGFLHFLPATMPTGVAGQFVGALFVTHYLAVVFGLELIAGLLLLANRFVVLAIAILAPVLVNIVLFHACMAPEGFALAAVAVALWSMLFFRERAAFSALWVAKGTV
jgi:putative oxidoreductase